LNPIEGAKISLGLLTQNIEASQETLNRVKEKFKIVEVKRVTPSPEQARRKVKEVQIEFQAKQRAKSSLRKRVKTDFEETSHNHDGITNNSIL
jgi:hypothetical protein